MKLIELFEKKMDHDKDSFKRWFRNSKTRDDDGAPQVFYHATPKDFRAFKVGGVDPKISGHAIWLSPYKHVQAAAHNVGGAKRGYKDGTQVMPVYAKIEKPLIIDDKNSLEWAREVFANGSNEFPQLLPKAWVDEVTKDGEYDGIIFDGEKLGWGEGTNEVIVFSSKQIKSAIGNSGEYDPEDEDITK